ncbi:MAG: signal recognition particle protein [Myxococcota bacterium]
MFSSLEDRFAEVLKKVRGQGSLNEKNVKEALRDVRLSLLEADVHFKVVKDFVNEVKARALGQDVQASLTPGQEFTRIVAEELTKTMGGESALLDLARKPPIKILLMGLQGSGKTTTSGKLALRIKNEGKRPFLVPADLQRPAAVKQLQQVGQQVEVAVHDTDVGSTVEKTVQEALEVADRRGYEVVIVDTAGRLAIDAELMEELRRTKEAAEPHYTLLVVDAMTGQDAVNVATEFNQQVGIDGVVMTKLDGDARGGAALSVRAVTGAPIYFAGLGEKMDALEPFHPERIAQRILGMGDVLGLIEKTQQAYDEKKAEKMARKMKRAEFTLDDFKEQMAMIRQMGDMKELLAMIPGASQAMKKMGAAGPDPDKEFRRIEAIINSMTAKERHKPDILNGSRRKRIALGSGTTVAEVNSFMKRFKDARKMMKRMSKMGPGAMNRMMKGMGGGRGRLPF